VFVSGSPICFGMKSRRRSILAVKESCRDKVVLEMQLGKIFPAFIAWCVLLFNFSELIGRRNLKHVTIGGLCIDHSPFYFNIRT
jgi:hypothetical protein